jgi:cytochrome c-type biogenesis protein
VVAPDLLGPVALAAGAGVGTFFSPCAYALLPGYVGYYVAATGDDQPPLAGTAARGVAAALGVVLAFGALSIAAVVAGEAVAAYLPAVEAFVGVALLAVGVTLVAGRGSWLHVPLPERRASVTGFLAFGALYALAAAGCVAPLFLAVVFRSLTLSPAATAATLGTYAATVGALVLGATVATAVGHGIGVDRIAPRATRVVRIGGITVAVAGVVQLYVALGPV